MTRRLKRTRHGLLPLAGLALALGGSLIYNYQSTPREITPSANAQAASVAGLDVYVTTRQTSYSHSVISPAFTTSQPREILLALLASDGPILGQMTFSSVTGGKLTWRLASRSNKSLGDAEIWAAQTTTRLTDARVTATRNSGTWHGMLTVISIPDPTRSLPIVATGNASAASGQPSVTLGGVPAGSWIYAVGNDWDQAIPRSVGAGEALIGQSVDTRVQDTYWAQRLTAPSTAPSVTVTDSAPTNDDWNLAAVAIAGGSPSGGSVVPAAAGTSAGAPTPSTTTPSTTGSAPQPTLSDTSQPTSAPNPAPAPSPSTSTPTATPSPAGSTGGTPYVQPGTQGYRGAVSALTVYSAANGQVPAAGCTWNLESGETAKYLSCDDTNLTLDHAYIQGSLDWDGCGSLTITNSIVDWEASSYWFSVYADCAAPGSGATVTVSDSTFETANDIPYTGKSDIGAITVYSNIPMLVSNSLFKDFPQGIDPNAGSVIKDNEIYTSDLTCWLNASAGTTSACHDDGMFSQGGNDITYEGNYISVPADSTAAIFYQSSPNSTGNQVIGNYLKGGSYTLYNEDSDGLMVENNTFAGANYGDVALCSGSWGTWTGNVQLDGTVVAAPASTCSN
jgi:hypothetical protein